ncbi:hypothetical protein CBM2633_P130007 [Cupriavidus taiwanensis]|uniref:Uncharacterized protein n=2 Tax=Cupriavidus TaxID=106589 RepID=A0A375GND8_9BURK|nr:hypothetical protein CBM2592_P160006 [Cupriavidus taiwanensis]SOZ40423.1 hypothetical protein CBM2605_P130007 [Cupriavidus neocaledonicus]SOY74371.1 hypothetical protein CBM2585_P130006 [Cupriavidus taiwanensis]SOY74378.1 hypothetical protein CBM2588_P150007 [Cupriavidus taiwanensis]SOY77452.1 hypothetical protein CBM2586_P130007 [Cupriavidus taiwanensis]
MAFKKTLIERALGAGEVAPFVRIEIRSF